MLRLLLDENFDQRILRGLRLQIPRLDYLIVQETELRGQNDPAVLAWAAEHRRILVTHDVNTITKYAYERLTQGETLPGVIIVPDDLAPGVAIAELAVLVECCEAYELQGQVKYIPI